MKHLTNIYSEKFENSNRSAMTGIKCRSTTNREDIETFLRPHDLLDIVGSFKALPSFDRCMKQSITTLSIFSSNSIIDFLVVKVSVNCYLIVDIFEAGLLRCSSDCGTKLCYFVVTDNATLNIRRQVDKIKPSQQNALMNKM